MSDAIFDQLKELFPDVSEEFLQGICDAHKDEDATVEELIEVILLFEHRPLRENVTNQLVENLNCNETVVQSEVSSITDYVKINRPVENESSQQAVPTVNVLSSKGQTSSFEKFIDVNEETVHIVSSFDYDSKINVDVKNTGLGSQSSNLVSENQSKFVISSNVSPLQDQYYENEDDSSPECSIKYLMEERGVMERCNIKTECSELKDPQESESASNNRITDESSISSNEVNNHQGNVKGSLKCKRVSTLHKKVSSVPRKCSYLAIPHHPVRRTTLRSCKIKNEGKILPRKVMNRRPSSVKEGNSNSCICSSNFLDIDSKYSLLCKIFTDADPTYLLDQCEFLTDHEKILAFISNNLELRDYPKVEVVKEEPKLMDGFHCTVADFVQVIPDPEAEFSNSNYIRNGYEENAEIYLKAR
jgi:hypothetical protein